MMGDRDLNVVYVPAVLGGDRAVDVDDPPNDPLDRTEDEDSAKDGRLEWVGRAAAAAAPPSLPLPSGRLGMLGACRSWCGAYCLPEPSVLPAAVGDVGDIFLSTSCTLSPTDGIRMCICGWVLPLYGSRTWDTRYSYRSRPMSTCRPGRGESGEGGWGMACKGVGLGEG